MGMEATMLHGDPDLVFTDRRGWPKVSGLHDARLKTLSVEFGQRLVFNAVGDDGQQTGVMLDGLHMLNIDGLWEGMIIDSVAIWRIAEDLDDTSGGSCNGAWDALLAGRVHDDRRASEIARLRHTYDGSHLVAVSSSYGGELQALCRQVLIDGRRVASV